MACFSWVRANARLDNQGGGVLKKGGVNECNLFVGGVGVAFFVCACAACACALFLQQAIKAQGAKKQAKRACGVRVALMMMIANQC